MSEAITLELISQVGLLLAAVIGLVGGRRKLRQIGADAAEARNQTANTHDTNLRDDIDSMRREIGVVKDDVGGVKDDIAGVHAELRGVRKDINGLRDDDGEIRRQMRIDAERAQAALKAHIDSAREH